MSIQIHILDLGLCISTGFKILGWPWIWSENSFYCLRQYTV